MKKISLFIVLPLLLTTLINSPSGFAATRGIRVVAKTGQSLYLYKNYYALVVGVSNYEKWPRLPNAANDAKEVASKLKELGFEVKLVLDPTSREMKTVLNEMVYRMGPEENRALLFYYAGHGETETLADKTKMGYIVPRDCPLLEKDPLGFATHAISMRDIESVSMRIKSKHVLMLFDSCFSGSLFALVRAVPDDITEKSTLPVRQYITAGREDEQVPDKSMFKRCFLIGLDGDADLTGDGYITGSELGMYLADKVVNYTHRRQHPQYGKINNPDLDRGDFIFALKIPSKSSPPASKAPPASKTPPPSLDAEKQRLAEERVRLERQRQELERLKMEIERKKLEAERKRLEAEKEKLEMAKLPPEKKYSHPTAKSSESGRDGTFSAHANGVVKDSKTGFEWIAGPDRDMTWDEAKSWVESLNIAGGGWRMPKIKELKTLYKEGSGTRNISTLLKTTGWAAWTDEKYGLSAAWIFYFRFGGGYENWSLSSSSEFRAFAVRSRSERKRLEAEKEKLEMAKLPPEPKYSPPTDKSSEVGRDGTFIAYANGVVKDKKTGFEWIAGPDRNMNWNKSKSWVESLNVAGGGWRMPKIAELKTLYKKGTGTRNITQLLKTTGWWVWSGETKDSSSAWHLYFSGGDKSWSARTTSGNLRAFAVRSRSERKRLEAEKK